MKPKYLPKNQQLNIGEESVEAGNDFLTMTLITRSNSNSLSPRKGIPNQQKLLFLYQNRPYLDG